MGFDTFRDGAERDGRAGAIAFDTTSKVRVEKDREVVSAERRPPAIEREDCSVVSHHAETTSFRTV